MTGIYYKQNGSWTPVKRPYVKRNGIWTPVKNAYVKDAGVWTESFAYDNTPPNPPEIDLSIIQNRYISVGIRLPGTANYTDLKRIRVLVSRTAMPTTPFGDGYLSVNDNNWPNENWSEWWYNHANANSNHPDTSVVNYKSYPANVTDATNLPGGQFYYFAAWSEDFDGNWSIGTFSKIWMPKQGQQAAQIVLKEIEAQANQAGSLDLNGVDFTAGPLIARDSPRSNGIWYHGNQFTNSVGATGKATIRTAQIRVSRANDAGQPTANVRLYWHGHQSGDLPVGGGDMNDPTVVGTINKGETKWFDIPSAWYSNFNTQIKGFGLRYGTEAKDYIEARSLDVDLRCGEVHLVWEEDR